jgi:hypothetical protein
MILVLRSIFSLAGELKADRYPWVDFAVYMPLKSHEKDFKNSLSLLGHNKSRTGNK